MRSILKAADNTGLILLFIVVGTEVYVLDFVFDHFVDDSCKFVGGSGYSGRATVLSSYSSVEGTKGTVGMGKSKRRHAQSFIGSVFSFFGEGGEDNSAGLLVFRGYSEPGAKMLRCRPLGHIRTDIGDNVLHGGYI